MSNLIGQHQLTGQDGRSAHRGPVRYRLRVPVPGFKLEAQLSQSRYAPADHGQRRAAPVFIPQDPGLVPDPCRER